jgi:hypothetical protein
MAVRLLSFAPPFFFFSGQSLFLIFRIQRRMLRAALNSLLIVLLLLAAVSLRTAAASPFSDFKVFGYNPVARPGAIVNGSGPNARFTVFSPYVIRMEYSHVGVFEDRATLTFLNRNLPVPPYTTTVKNGWLSIATSAVTVNYQLGEMFAPWTLTATTAAGISWKYGDVDYGNLLGTVKSLDELCTITLNCTQNANTQVHDESLHCGWGVVSRGGWTTIDDSADYIMSSTPGSWFSPSMKNSNDIDLYFFGHGSNYRAALQDYTNLAGKTPMFHKAMLGAWFTRWYDFDNADVERLVSIFEQQSIPLDTLVLDMNWHTKNSWTGFSWDRQLFPNPEDMIAFFRSKNLRFLANLHDAEGVGPWEEKYPDMCQAMGIDPASQQTVVFAPLNATYMHALDDIVLKAAGFDFYWIDWQQGGENGGCPGDHLNPTFITDHVRSTDNIRNGKNKRDAILARWGGMGSHRYPVGFSGDVSQLTWQCFAYQPYFSVTAANVAYGSISHDLVGPPNDHELHVRWMQFGAFSGVMRIHDRGMSAGSCYPDCPYVNIWKLPFRYFDAIRSAMQRRVALLPYMYTMMRNAYDTGVPLVYPMYYDWPSSNMAYAMGEVGTHAQYMFGPSILVAPITEAGDTNQITQKSIWLPPALWYDDVFGTLIQGGGSITQSYDISEIPMFILAGSVIPRIPNPSKIGVGSDQFTSVDIYIYPGNTTGSFTLYEDASDTLDYINGQYATTVISYVRSGLRGITITVTAASGSYAGQVTSRGLRFFLVGSMPIASVSVGGASLPYSRFPAASSFSYDGQTGTATIDAGAHSTASAHTISVTLAADQNDALVSRMKGYAARAMLAKRTMDNFRETPYSNSEGPGMTKQAASRAVDLSYLAGTNISGFLSKIGSAYTNLISSALSEIGGNPNPPPPSPAQTSLIQLWSASRKDMCLCGSSSCVSVNSDYEFMWIEGYQPANPSSAGVVPLNDYYSNQYQDNWADVTTNAPNGYLPAVFDNGYVLSKNTTAGLTCLQLWVSPSTNDHMTLATEAGLNWALKNGYVNVNNCIGYTYTAPTLKQEARSHVSDAATSAAQELLQTVLPN